MRESEDPALADERDDEEVLSGPELEALLATGPELDLDTAILELENALNLSEEQTLTDLKNAGGIKLTVGE